MSGLEIHFDSVQKDIQEGFYEYVNSLAICQSKGCWLHSQIGVKSNDGLLKVVEVKAAIAGFLLLLFY